MRGKWRDINEGRSVLMRTAISTTSKFWRRYPWSAEFYGTSPAGKTHQRGDGSLTFARGFGEVNGTWMTGTPPATSPGLFIHSVVDSVEATGTVVEQGGEVAQPIGGHAREVTARFRDPAGNVLGLYQDRGSG